MKNTPDPKSVQKRRKALKALSAQPNSVSVKSERRYYIDSDDSGHDYFVEVGYAGEFAAWLDAELEPDTEYEGYDYEQNRIDGRFTFTDPKCQ